MYKFVTNNSNRNNLILNVMDIKNKQNDLGVRHTSGKLDNGNNPKGVASLKQTRNTHEVPAGTAYLRGLQNGN